MGRKTKGAIMRKLIIWSLVGLVSVPTGYFVQRNLRYASFRDIGVKEGAWYDVRMYGAIAGDQISDVSAFQAAADSIAADGGGTLFFPPGQYEFYGDSLRVYSNTTISAYGAVFNDTTGGKQFIFIDGDSDIVISGGEFDGNADNDGGYTEFDHGISAQDAFRITIQDVFIHNMAGDGIYFADVDHSTISNVKIEAVNVNASGPQIGRNGIAIVEGSHNVISNPIIKGGLPAGIDLEANAGLTVSYIEIVNPDIRDSHLAGINMQGTASGSSITNITITGGSVNCAIGTVVGIRADSVYDWLINGVNVSGSTSHGIYVLDNTDDGSIKNCKVHNGAAKGIVTLEGCRNITFENNDVYENLQDGFRLDGASGSENLYFTLSDNRVWDNDSGNTSVFSGIWIEYADSLHMSGNFSFDTQADPTQVFGYDLDNCDLLHFDLSNQGYGNESRLFNITNVTKLSQGGVQTYFWTQDNIAQGQTNQVTRLGSAASAWEIVMPFDCRVIGWSIASSDTVDTDTITVNIMSNGVAIGESMNINATSAVRYNDEQFIDDDLAGRLFSEGDRIGVLYTSGGSLAPTTLDIVIAVLVRF